MLNKEEITHLLNETAFDPAEYWVTSGAAMVLYGIKPATKDIDLGCTSPMADRLENEGYPTEILPDRTRKITYSETIEIFENWLEDKAVFWEGFPIVSTDGMIRMKEKLGREKDFKDILLIKEFQNKYCGSGRA